MSAPERFCSFRWPASSSRARIRRPPRAHIRAVRMMMLAADSAASSQEFAAEIRTRAESRLGFRVAGKMTSRPAEVG